MSLELREFTAPLLPADRPASPPPPRKKARRIPRPLLLIAVPALLALLYATLTHIAPLPPLPSIRIVHSHDDAAQNVLTVAEECACGIPSLPADPPSSGEHLCDIYGKETLARSRLFLGTGARVQRMLATAQLERRPLKVGVLGGSVSACHAVHPSPSHPQGDPSGPGCYTTLFKQWLNHRLPLASPVRAEGRRTLIPALGAGGTYDYEWGDWGYGFEVSGCDSARRPC